MRAINNVTRKVRLQERGDGVKDEEARGDEQTRRFAAEDKEDLNVSGYSKEVLAKTSGTMSKAEKKGQKLMELYAQVQELQDHEDFNSGQLGIIDGISSDEEGVAANNLDSLFESTEDVIENRYGAIAEGLGGEGKKKNQELVQLIDDIETFEVSKTG